jgi:hypothetical protein
MPVRSVQRSVMEKLLLDRQPQIRAAIAAASSSNGALR